MPAETHVEQGPLGRDEIFEIVRDRLADILEIEPSTISEGQSFVDDLDADSLALIELVEALEEELSDRTVGFRIDDEDLADLKTVRDAVDYVHERTRGVVTPARPVMEGGIDALAERIGHTFADISVLERAMAHRSWCAEHPGTASNERLEFLGDAVLGWVVADLAFRRFDGLSEGALTGVRKGVVNAAALAEASRDLGIGEFLLLGRGEDAAGGRDKPSILSDAFEAVIGALYVDGGAQVTYEFIERRVGDRLEETAARLDHLDHKSRLQELAVRAGYAAPTYVSRSTGPDHAKLFVARVLVGDEYLGDGSGSSKKTAEQAAAQAAADVLERRLSVPH